MAEKKIQMKEMRMIFICPFVIHCLSSYCSMQNGIFLKSVFPCSS